MTGLTFEEVMRNQMSGYESKEIININTLTIITQHIEDIVKSRNIIMHTRAGEHMTIEQIKTALKKYRVNRQQGKRIIYRFAKGMSHGRLFSQTLSGQGISRQFRHTLFKDDYIDIDIVNCHPVLLSWFCRQRKYTCKKLDYYIMNRDKVLEELISQYNLTKEDAKALLLKVINGGSLDKSYHQDTFLVDFYNEMVAILNSVATQATEEERKSKEFNVAGSLLNHHLCCIENYVLKQMVEFFEDQGFKNMILCFDGLMVHNSAIGCIDKLQNRLNRLEIPNLIVAVKPMNEDIDLSPYENKDDLPINPLLDTDLDYTINDFIHEFSGRTFSSMQEFKSMLIPKYCKVFAHFRDTSQPLYRCPENQLVFTYPNTDLFHWDVAGTKVCISDVIRRFPMNVPVYDDYGFYPDGFDCRGEECPVNTFNIWTGFRAKRLDKFDMVMIQPILDHILHVWADDDEKLLEYLLDYLAHIIQFPWKKTGVLLLMFGLQRIGKNIITNFILNKVIGKNWGSDNVGVGLFQDRFNVELLNQIFTVCNELPQLTSTTRNGVFDTLKSAITDDDRKYEIKGGRKWNSMNYVNCICTTNHDFTYNIEEGDGRILALKCSPRYKGDFEYFKHLNENLKQINADHFITFLSERKITHDLRQIPMTQLRKEMIELSLPTPVRFINNVKEEDGLIDNLLVHGLAKLHGGVYHSTDNIPQYNEIKVSLADMKIQSSHLYTLYGIWCKERGENIMSHTAFSRIVKNDCNVDFTRTIKGIFFHKFW